MQPASLGNKRCRRGQARTEREVSRFGQSGGCQVPGRAEAWGAFGSPSSLAVENVTVISPSPRGGTAASPAHNGNNTDR